MKKSTIMGISMSLLLAFLLCGTMAHAQAPVPSNYGWKNLSYGYVSAEGYQHGVMHLEEALDGEVLHVLFATGGDSKQLWYRRSNDLGVTWEEPVCLTKTLTNYAVDDNWKMMSVDNGKVFIAFVELENNEYMKDRMMVFSSTDGKAFEKSELTSYVAEQRIVFVKTEAHDGKVAIAYKNDFGDELLHVAVSGDGGKTYENCPFRVSHKDRGFDVALTDFAFDGRRIVLLSAWSYSYQGLRDGWVFATVSDDLGKTFTTTPLGTLFTDENGSIYSKSQVWEQKYDGNSNLAIDGDNIYATFSDQCNEGDENRYLVVVRSDDGGKTWKKPLQLCTDEYKPEGLSEGRSVIARGGHVYVMIETWRNNAYQEFGRGIFCSDDAGETFRLENSWEASCYTRSFAREYRLQFDDNDPTGRTVYAVFNNAAWLKTTDGFHTLAEGCSNDSEYNYSDNLYTHVLVDASGRRHWLARYYPADDRDTYELVYNREDHPAAVADNMALRVSSFSGHKRKPVNIPTRASLRCDSAMTVELWVKPEEGINGIICQHNSDDERGGWRLFGSKRPEGEIWNTRTEKVSHSSDALAYTPRWHHLALTYNAAERRSRLYQDGVLVSEKETNGELNWGWQSILIGSSYDSYFLLDDLRIWNRELTPDEVTNAMQNAGASQGEGLLMHLGFDGTLLDLTGHGNNGMGSGEVEFVPSDRDIPSTKFDAVVAETGEVVLSNHSGVGCDSQWLFGDGERSTLGMPTHKYRKAGEYTISLVSTNATTAAGISHSVTVSGLASISPTHAGNRGLLLATITGGGITERSEVTLVRGSNVIKGTDVRLERPGIIKAMFNVDEAELGDWSLVVDGKEMPSAFRMEEVREAETWMTFQSGHPGKMLYKQWLTYTLSYGNRGNVDAYNVPLYLFISEDDDTDVEFVDFSMELPVLDKEQLTQQQIDEVYGNLKSEMGDYIPYTDDNGGRWRFYPLMAPVVKAGSSRDIHIRIKTATDLKFVYATSEGWGSTDDVTAGQMYARQWAARNGGSTRSTDPDEVMRQGQCIWDNFASGILDAAIGAIPFVGCAWGIGKTIWQAGTDDSKDRMWNLGWNVAGTALTCASGGIENYFKMGWAIAQAAGVGLGIANSAANAKRCMGPGNEGGARVVSSWDPNEMVGPEGYMDADSIHWVKPGSAMPYTILFENKKTATAPAHTVYVSDTLDASAFMLDDFAFTSVGWGDTLVSVPADCAREFTIDVDMRPAKDYIVRATGKLYAETGVVEWGISTLNPSTMDLEEDPEVGFLPPNDENHVGEGFVAFAVGQKDGIASGTRIANQASIVFDANDPILTNVYVNGIDADLPVSAAYLVTEEGNQLKVQWSGSDASSGVSWYDVLMSRNDGAFERVRSHYEGDYVLLDKDPSTKYSFYTVVTDHVGWTEEKADICEVTYVPSNIDAAQADAVSLTADGRTCQLLLPHTAGSVSVTVYDASGRELDAADLGGGNRFTLTLPAAGASMVAVEADGQRYVWKLASK